MTTTPAAQLCRTLRVSRSYHLAQSTLHVLAYLSEQGGSARLTAIADELDITCAACTGTIDQLEKHGYVTRVHSREDRRAIAAHLTTKGEEALATCLHPERREPFPSIGLRYSR